MTVYVNGEQKEVPEGTTVQGLVLLAGLGQAACAAEVNKQIVPKKRHADTALREGDRIELVSLVGGG
jgi:sulfur carrier protein